MSEISTQTKRFPGLPLIFICFCTIHEQFHYWQNSPNIWDKSPQAKPKMGLPLFHDSTSHWSKTYSCLVLFLLPVPFWGHHLHLKHLIITQPHNCLQMPLWSGKGWKLLWQQIQHQKQQPYVMGLWDQQVAC